MYKPATTDPHAFAIEGSRYPARDSNQKAPIKRILMGRSIATSRENGEILDSMRNIAMLQLNQLETVAKERLLTSSEAAALHRVAQVFNIVDSSTRREAEGVDFSNMSDEDLAAAEAHAEKLVNNK